MSKITTTLKPLADQGNDIDHGWDAMFQGEKCCPNIHVDGFLRYKTSDKENSLMATEFPHYVRQYDFGRSIKFGSGEF